MGAARAPSGPASVPQTRAPAGHAVNHRRYEMLKSFLIALPCLLALHAGPAVCADDLLPPDRDRLARLRSALSEAPRANAAEFRVLASQHGQDPLWPWIELHYLRGRGARLDADRVLEFLARHGDTPPARTLRRAALRELAERGDWPGFRRIGLTERDARDAELRCHGLSARFARGDDPEVIDDALAEWDRGDSLPKACDPVITHLRRLGRLDTARTLGRIEAAAERGNVGLMRHLARGLEATLRSRVEAEARFIEAPSSAAMGWTSTPRTRAVIEAGLNALARRDPGAAESLLDGLAPALSLEAERIGRLRHAIALWSAASFLPEAAGRFARVPTRAFDARLHEWRVREAIARRQPREALDALAAMPGEQRERARWQLIEARLRMAVGETGVARALLERASAEPNFHGFLAAELSGRDYTLCPLPAASGEAARRTLERSGVARALDLYSLDRPGWAHQEWAAALTDQPLPQQALAVEAAFRRGWYDRASQTLGSGEGMRYYAQRFPLPHEKVLRHEARRHDLPAAWVAGLIRAESSWMPSARSPADARGLMQLLPATGRDTARRLGRSFGSPDLLFQPTVSIELGSAYLRQMLDAHDGKPALATAAYNAGPAAVGRWLGVRPPVAPLLDDSLLWLETIPFHETREYVARVMAFSLIYDWRLQGRAGSLLARLEGRMEQGERDFSCPVTAPNPG